jgi:alkylation response protein AidB-like acyl-CoA dehydrogenase
MVGRIIARFGTDELKREILPRAARGEINFALGYSEPSGGSDIFAAKTKAVRDGDDWIINGSKIFTSQGHLAAYTLLVTRTNPDAPKHQGVTMFVVPLDLPGYECAPIATVGGERTNTTFYDNMRVADRYRLGDVNGGATVLAFALTLEQSAADYYVSALNRQLRAAHGWAHTRGPNGRRPIESADVRGRLARVWTRRDVLDCLGKRCLWSSIERCQHKSFGPMAKLFGSEAWIMSTGELLDLMAPEGLIRGHTDTGMIELEYRKSIASTVYAGVSEVMRSLIAESALGLPRSRV